MPFIDRKALGGVAGIIGAGGNIGGVIAGFMVKFTGSVPAALFYIGLFVVFAGCCCAAVRFSKEHKEAEQRLYDEAIAQRDAMDSSLATAS
jgi:NNP family nitrate/nitrite transporter-like MFS transporter